MESNEQRTERLIRSKRSLFEEIEKKWGADIVLELFDHLAGVVTRISVNTAEPDLNRRMAVLDRILDESTVWMSKRMDFLQQLKEGGEKDGNT